MNIKFEVKMTKKAMFDFMLYTSYTSLSGIVGVIFGGVTLVLGIRQCMFGSYSTAATFFLFAAIFLIGNPLHLKERCCCTFHRMNKVCLMNGEISERQFQPVSL